MCEATTPTAVIYRVLLGIKPKAQPNESQQANGVHSDAAVVAVKRAEDIQKGRLPQQETKLLRTTKLQLTQATSEEEVGQATTLKMLGSIARQVFSHPQANEDPLPSIEKLLLEDETSRPLYIQSVIDNKGTPKQTKSFIGQSKFGRIN